MDLALMAMKKLKAEGKLADQEESDEINACSIVVPIEVDGVEEEWLVNFKNETHNHPTEIEPFGGAATCLGGAIRDPLSGRTYVYQAMRITGAADPTVSVKDTLKGKLPQKKLVRRGCTRLQFLRKPDRSCNRSGKRDLPSELCRKAYGDRCGAWSSTETCSYQREFGSGRYHHSSWRTYRT